MGGPGLSWAVLFVASFGISASAGDWAWTILGGLLACLAPGWGQLKGWSHLGCWDGWASLSSHSLRAPPSLYGLCSRIIWFLTWWLRDPQRATALLGLSLEPAPLPYSIGETKPHTQTMVQGKGSRARWDHPCYQPLHLPEWGSSDGTQFFNSTFGESYSCPIVLLCC